VSDQLLQSFSSEYLIVYILDRKFEGNTVNSVRDKLSLCFTFLLYLNSSPNLFKFTTAYAPVIVILI
jgi:hypothetical protein